CSASAAIPPKPSLSWNPSPGSGMRCSRRIPPCIVPRRRPAMPRLHESKRAGWPRIAAVHSSNRAPTGSRPRSVAPIPRTCPELPRLELGGGFEALDQAEGGLELGAIPGDLLLRSQRVARGQLHATAARQCGGGLAAGRRFITGFHQRRMGVALEKVPERV